MVNLYRRVIDSYLANKATFTITPYREELEELIVKRDRERMEKTESLIVEAVH